MKNDNIPVVKVPKGRFYTAIDLYDGVTMSEEDGGFVKANEAAEINFMLVRINFYEGVNLPLYFKYIKLWREK